MAFGIMVQFYLEDINILHIHGLPLLLHRHSAPDSIPLIEMTLIFIVLTFHLQYRI